MMKISDIDFDIKHIWHPYSSLNNPIPAYLVKKAEGSELELMNGKRIIDGMASWWAVIHGYNHPLLNKSIKKQLKKMTHIMFGGITHLPAIKLCRKLISITDKKLECIFLSDSGSVSIEVALKMALQYWKSRDINKKKFISFRNAYHGDTFGAMSVCDPENSMHILYNEFLPVNFFVQAPKIGFYEEWNPKDILPLEKMLNEFSDKVAAVILEPIVQGVGGMRMYHPKYLYEVRKLCDYYDVLLILDEIATGFGRTGRLFAYEYSKISPDILCIGKALTGGYISLAATITTRHISDIIGNGIPGSFMHGPTFMANPLACSVAYTSINLLIDSNWKNKVGNIEQQLKEELFPLKNYKNVVDVRVLGAIGVVEVKNMINLSYLQSIYVKNGVWIRPFRNLIYLMPPFIINSAQLSKLIDVVRKSLNLI